jgi:hypothetical protein
VRARPRALAGALGALGLAAAPGCGEPVYASDYYVRQGTGCTRAYPRCGVDVPGQEFDDVDQCAAVLRPGDTCWIKDGVYRKGIDSERERPYQPRRGGEPGRPVTFRAHPGHRPVFRDGGVWDLGVSGAIDHVTYAGLAIEGVLKIQGQNEQRRVRGVTVDGCDVSGGGGKDDGNWSGIFVQWAEDLVIRDSRIHDVRAEGAAKGVSVFNGRRVLFEHNHVYGNPSEGIFDKEGGEDNVYRRNLFERNGTHLKINNQRDERGLSNVRTQIYENLFLCDPDGPSSSILMLSQPTEWEVYHNTSWECDGIEVRSKSGPAQAKAVFHNVWAWSRPGRTAWSSEAGDDREPAFMDFNLYAPGGRFRENRYTDAARSVEGLEAWRGAEHPLRYDEHSLEAEPLFANPALRDFRLAEGSPGRGAGRAGEDLGAWPRGGAATAVGPRPLRAAVGAPPPAAPERALAAPSCREPGPGLLFCEDFEAGSLDRGAWRDVELGGEGAALRVQGAAAARGRFAAEGRAASGRETDLWAARGFGDHPLWGDGERVEEVVLTSALRFGEGFAFGKEGGAKIFILGAFEGWSAGWPDPNVWSPYYLLVQWRRGDRPDRPRELEGVLHRKTGCVPGAVAKGCSAWRNLPANLAHVPFEAGRWYELRLRAVLNRPGRADGILEAWLDGQKVLAYADVDWRGRYERHGLNHFLLSRRASAKSPSQSLFWDDVALAVPARAGAATTPARAVRGPG